MNGNVFVEWEFLRLAPLAARPMKIRVENGMPKKAKEKTGKR